MAKKKKILIVEDERDAAEFVESLLILGGYETHISRDGQDAINRARNLFPDLILLDIMLPKLNGFEVCKLLKRDPALQSTPIIMVTSLHQMGDAEKAFAVGANDYITKPYDSTRLMAKVKKHLPQ